jgi:hypothetical protein
VAKASGGGAFSAFSQAVPRFSTACQVAAFVKFVGS